MVPQQRHRSERCDCIVNKTALSAKTNRMIGGITPSAYLSRVQKNAGITPARMDEILASRLVAPRSCVPTTSQLSSRRKKSELLDRVETAMGEPIARDIVQPMVEEAGDYEEEEPAEGEMVA